MTRRHGLELMERSTSRSTEESTVDKMARWIATRGWQAPALLMSELLRPFAFVGSQIVLAAEPLWGRSPHRVAVRSLSALMEDRTNWEKLALAIEAYSVDSDAVGPPSENLSTEGGAC